MKHIIAIAIRKITRTATPIITRRTITLPRRIIILRLRTMLRRRNRRRRKVIRRIGENTNSNNKKNDNTTKHIITNIMRVLMGLTRQTATRRMRTTTLGWSVSVSP